MAPLYDPFPSSQIDLSKTLRYVKSQFLMEYASFNGPLPAGMELNERMLPWQSLPDEVRGPTRLH